VALVNRIECPAKQPNVHGAGLSQIGTTRTLSTIG
jgi:hypothetical protein